MLATYDVMLSKSIMLENKLIGLQESCCDDAAELAPDCSVPPRQILADSEVVTGRVLVARDGRASESNTIMLPDQIDFNKIRW